MGMKSSSLRLNAVKHPGCLTKNAKVLFSFRSFLVSLVAVLIQVIVIFLIDAQSMPLIPSSS